MAQGLRVFAACSQSQSSVLSTHARWFINTYNSNFMGSNTFWPPQHTCGTHKHMHAHTDKKENKIFKKKTTCMSVPNNSCQHVDTFSFLRIHFTLLVSGKHMENLCFFKSEVCRRCAEAFLLTVLRRDLPVRSILSQKYFYCILRGKDMELQSNVVCLRSKWVEHLSG